MKIRVQPLMLVLAVSMVGCGSAKKAAAPVPVLTENSQDDPKAVALLKHSMDVYAGFTSFKATCKHTVSDGHSAPLQSTRAITYARPNRYRVVSTSASSGVKTAISDGKSTLEFEDTGNYPPRLQTAPDSISGVYSMLMRHPMYGGTLLYQFFGGSFNYDDLVSSERGPVTFGSEETVPGETAEVVKFYGQQSYGHVEALIGEQTGLVYRIKYDSEPLIQLMQDPATQKKVMDAAKGASDEKARAAARALAVAARSQLQSTELYQDISTSNVPDEKLFALVPPPGKTPMDLGSRGMPPHPPVPLGAAAPDFTVSGLDGKPVSLSQFKGHPVLLDFWATWCGPCVASLPHTQELFAKGSSKGLQVLAISHEPKETIASFIKEKSYTFPVGVDDSASASSAYRTSVIPTTVVVDADGKLVAYIIGGGQDKAIARALAKVGISVQ